MKGGRVNRERVMRGESKGEEGIGFIGFAFFSDSILIQKCRVILFSLVLVTTLNVCVHNIYIE